MNLRDRTAGRRVDDPPPPKQSLKFRAGLAIRKYPVHFGVLLALLILLIPTTMLVVATAQNRNLVHRIQDSRAQTTLQFCHAINNLGHVNDNQNGYIAAIIVNGTKQSRIFEPLILKFHGKPYRVRLVEAKKQAAGLKQTQPPPINCKAQVNRIERQK